jgi:hypothetical protein
VDLVVGITYFQIEYALGGRTRCNNAGRTKLWGQVSRLRVRIPCPTVSPGDRERIVCSS